MHFLEPFYASVFVKFLITTKCFWVEANEQNPSKDSMNLRILLMLIFVQLAFHYQYVVFIHQLLHKGLIVYICFRKSNNR